jgi:hypothetical protein
MKSSQMIVRRAVLATLAMAMALTGAGTMRAQQDQPDRSQFAGMERIAGEVTAVSGSTVTVKTEEDATRQIVTTTNTRIMRSRATAKVTDLKVGDGVVAVGNLDGPNGTLHAALLFATDAAQVKAMRENLGKTYITGKVTAIDMTNATITVERPDHVAQTIGLDETTSFKRGQRPGATPATGAGQGAAAAPAASTESITLADIKIGDNVHGIGALKSGVFVPAELIVLPPGGGQGARHRGAEATPPPA